MQWQMEGRTLALYGAAFGSDEDFVKLDDRVWRVVCDPDDGYRSYCGDIELLASERYGDVGPFSPDPLAVVEVKPWTAPLYDYSDGCDGFQLVDPDGHVWLTIGTDNTHDYYPSYTFSWTPKETIQPVIEEKAWVAWNGETLTVNEALWGEIEL